jgi:hypothetical protein
VRNDTGRLRHRTPSLKYFELLRCRIPAVYSRIANRRLSGFANLENPYLGVDCCGRMFALGINPDTFPKRIVKDTFSVAFLI